MTLMQQPQRPAILSRDCGNQVCVARRFEIHYLHCRARGSDRVHERRQSSQSVQSTDLDVLACSQALAKGTALTQSDPTHRADFGDKRVLVTGGASGIGRATVLCLARAGARVGIVDINRRGALALRDELRAAGHEAHCWEADAADEATIDMTMGEVKETLGGLDVLVNAAGQPTAYRDGSALEIWRRGVDQTLTSVMIVTRAAIPMLTEGDGGAVVSVSSIAAFGGSPDIAWYAAAKAGILSLTRSLAVELGPVGVRVNAVCPGLTETPRVTHLWENPEVRARFVAETPLRKLAVAEDIAEAILFLSSDRTAGHITGVHLIVDGGAASTRL